MLDSVFAIEPGHPPAAAVEKLDTFALAEECLARAGVYRMMAGVFIEEAGPDFLRAMRAPGLIEQLAAAGIHFDDDFLVADPGLLEDTLACEYATLFASSGGFPPVESVRLMGRFKQEPHFQVAQIYRQAGFQLNKGRFEVFPDQLGVELSFVGELLIRCAGALEDGDLEGYRRLDKEIKRFWTLHLGRWVRGYCRLIERAANHSFYRAMARFLGGFAEEEIAAMKLRNLEDLDMGRAVVPKSEVKVEFNPDEPVCGGCQPAAQGAAAAVHKLHDLRF